MQNMVLQAAILALTVKLTTGCGGYLVGSGNFTSPNYPNLYPVNIRCTWTLAANPGQYLSLRLLDIDTEYEYDYVQVFNEAATVESNQCNYVNRFSGGNFGNNRKDKTLPVGPNATVVFFSDSSRSASGFQMEYTSINITSFTDCGGHLVGSGSIASPDYRIFYRVISQCTWTLAANPGEHLSIRLVSLDKYDNVYIFNGTAKSTDSPWCELVHQYSGVTYYITYRTIDKAFVIGPTVTVVLFSDNPILNRQFELEYKSVNITIYEDCGGYLVGSGNITSPNYPNEYPMNGRCTWTISASAGASISLRLINVVTEFAFDYVYIYNGSMPASSYQNNYFARYSGRYYSRSNQHGSAKPLLLGPNATIFFTSDSSISASGFQIEYMSVFATPFTDCGGYHVGSGNITSPNYPNDYPMNSRCTWTIFASADASISLRLIYFVTESSLDNVYIYNGSAPTSSYQNNYFSRYSGSYYLSSNQYGSAKPLLLGPNATIFFTSDSSMSASGFQIEYMSVYATTFTDCGGYHVGSGNITSPNYPNDYPMNSRCTWTISASADASISLRLINVFTESTFDFVYIYNGSAPTSSYQNNYVSRYSGSYYLSSNQYGNAKPLLLGPIATIFFTSDSSMSASGFHIEYMSVFATPFTDCGGYLVGSGNITSPNYPNFYPANSRCTWTLSASAGLSISLRVMIFDTEYSFDYVQVYNGSVPVNFDPSNYSTNYSGRHYDLKNYYGIAKPLVLGPNVTVLFVSDSSISASGFRIEFTSFVATPFTDCGGYLVGSGNITSPNYPNFYPANSRCTWTLSASAGLSISLNIINFDTEPSYDYVYIYNESEPVNVYQNNYFSRHSGRYIYGNYHYGFQKPLGLGPNVTVYFVSDNSVSANGFQIEYESVNATPFRDCGGYLVGSGNITSPNYPNDYPANSYCTWTLSASAGVPISLRLIKVDTEASYDYLYIYNGFISYYYYLYNNFSRSSGKYTSYDFGIMRPLLLEPNVTVLFFSDSHISASGFQIEYETIIPFTDCGGYLVGSGNITSPKYPSFYPHNSRCTWRLSAPAGSSISLRLISFNVEFWLDYVYIYNGSAPANVYQKDYYNGKYSSYYSSFFDRSTKPLVFGQNVTVVFFSDNYFSASGFQIEYVTVTSSSSSSSSSSTSSYTLVTEFEAPSVTQQSRGVMIAFSSVFITVLLASVQLALHLLNAASA